MKCATVRDLFSRKIDDELAELENAEFDAHLAECAACSRDYRILSLPSRIAQVIPPAEPSPFFYARLKISIEGEAQDAAGWQVFIHLARQMIPALAGITLAMLLVFAYIQFSGNEPDLYKAYNRVFITEDQPHRMFSEEAEITDESVLNAIADQDMIYHRSSDLK
jgi:hypothetical protein